MFAEITPADVEAALNERRAAALSLSDVTAQYEASVVEATLLADDLGQLSVELGLRERELVVLRVDAQSVARELYMSGGSNGILGWFDLENYTDIEIRRGYLEMVAETDQALLARLQALEQSYLDQQALLEAAIGRQAEVTAELDALALEILEELEAADAAYQSVLAAYEFQEAEKARKAAEEAARLKAEEEARRAATSTTTTAPPGGGGGPTTTTTPPDEEPPPPPPPPPPSDGGCARSTDPPRSRIRGGRRGLQEAGVTRAST